MARTITLRRRATFDVESIVVYLGEVRQNPSTAKRFYNDFRSCLELLAETPGIGRPFRDEALDNKAMRWHTVGPYRVFYTYNKDTLMVWRVLHERQDLDDFALSSF